MKTRSRSSDSNRRWPLPKALIGMVHLPPLPGSSRASASLASIVDRAIREARMLEAAGFDAVVVENYGDAPFFPTGVPAETIAAMAVVADHVVRSVGVPVGVNMLRNDGPAALAVAAITDAAFVRINVLSGIYATDQGLITGDAARVLRERARLCPAVRIAADVHVKHSVPVSQPDIGLAASDTAYRGGADALIVSGTATGKGVDLDELRRVRAAVPDRPVWIGSGVTPQTAAGLLEIADGLIVGTCLKRGGRTEDDLDVERVRAFPRHARPAKPTRTQKPR